MVDAVKSLTQAETGARQQSKVSKGGKITGKFPPGLEWDVLQADAIVLLGFTHVLSESYMGYVKCFYALNSAHGKFSRLYSLVYPQGLDRYSTPTTSRTSSTSDLVPLSPTSTFSAASPGSSDALPSSPYSPAGNFFTRWPLATPKSALPKKIVPDGPVDRLILSGTAFGFGLFNLVFSMLPPKIRSVVGILGFQGDRRLALQALAVAAAGDDVHSHFAALTLMTYHGYVLQLSGFQADGEYIIRQYNALLARGEKKFPHGSLWLVNRAKIQRNDGHNQAAIETLNHALNPCSRPANFRQADAMLVFELAWVHLVEDQFEEAADAFLRMMQLNHWSHATYAFLAAGCYLSVGTPERRKTAQELFGRIPDLLERKRMGGRELPTEAYIRKKITWYKKKQIQRGGDQANFVECIRITPCDEFSIVWNNFSRVSKPIAESHIAKLVQLTPAVVVSSPRSRSSLDSPVSPPERTSRPDLELPDELCTRFVLLGLLHREIGYLDESREFFEAAVAVKSVETGLMTNTAYFELAVLVLKRAEAHSMGNGDVPGGIVGDIERWNVALSEASRYLQLASQRMQDFDLGTRLDSRIGLLRSEIELKRKMLGI
ncbi:hypothetical protein BS47DRAFT_1345927 [Hydnum rufescens UP504]|uniref:Uncharacterized protein n=1 Tax=Hydnum rufescens UP504 TaxID=1448309 RepID=A0A9P6DSG2_9AGAM|nr:hypothetical protein BS47DRAFT_1345927 [Hydnum rufescens UP504]